MGYDLHVVRTRSWLDRQQDPITQADVDALIASESGYAWASEDPQHEAEGSDGASRRHSVRTLEWQSAVLAWWQNGELSMKNPDEEQTIRLLDLAKSLGAMVVGDDDELYRTETGDDGQTMILFEPWDGETGAYEPAVAQESNGPGPWLWRMYLRLDRVIYRVMNGVERER